MGFGLGVIDSLKTVSKAPIIGQHQSAMYVKFWNSNCSSDVRFRDSLGGVSTGFSDVNSSSKLDTSSNPVCKKKDVIYHMNQDDH
jgi:hypothetical protein